MTLCEDASGSAEIPPGISFRKKQQKWCFMEGMDESGRNGVGGDADYSAGQGEADYTSTQPNSPDPASQDLTPSETVLETPNATDEPGKDGQAEDGKMYYCSHCPYKTKHTRMLARHSRKHVTPKKRKQKTEHRCTQCDYVATHKTKLNRHCKEMHVGLKREPGERKYSCEQCDYVASRKDCLRKHIVAKHTTDSIIKPYSCEQCDFRTARIASLRNHMKTHTDERPYPCPHCSGRWKTNMARQQHIERVHMGALPYMCGECGYRTVHKSHLVTHMRTHTGERPYKCSECDYRAAKKGHLTIHMATHKQGLSFACDQCDYKAKYNYQLSAHMKTHASLLYQCKECDFRATKQQHLDMHYQAKHCDDETYVCTMCEFTTAYASSLTQHMKTHNKKPSKNRRYKCDLCDYAIGRKQALVNHIARCHYNNQ
ncbi:zinc finger protein 711-like [Branchiostoma floridae x Branchiostoma belcheri]